MSFFSGEFFFTMLIPALVIALIIGLCEKTLKWYDIAVSVLFITLVLIDTPAAIIYFVIYFLIELALVKIYEQIRKKRQGAVDIQIVCFSDNCTPCVM